MNTPHIWSVVYLLTAAGSLVYAATKWNDDKRWVAFLVLFVAGFLETASLGATVPFRDVLVVGGVLLAALVWVAPWLRSSLRG